VSIGHLTCSRNITILTSKSRNYASFKVHFFIFSKDYSFVQLKRIEYRVFFECWKFSLLMGFVKINFKNKEKNVKN